MASILIYTSISILSVLTVFKLGQMSSCKDVNKRLDKAVQCVAFLIVMFVLMVVDRLLIK